MLRAAPEYRRLYCEQGTSSQLRLIVLFSFRELGDKPSFGILAMGKAIEMSVRLERMLLDRDYSRTRFGNELGEVEGQF